MGQAVKILTYEIHNLVRSRWLLGMGVLLLAATEVLFRFGGDPSRAVASLMNVVFLIVPLVSLVLGTVYFYSSREFNELLLAQPVNRTAIYLGKLAGFTAALSLVFALGTGLPFLLHGYGLGDYAGKVAILLLVGEALVIIFSAVAFLAATRYEDRVKGLGSVILLWFFLSAVYDGLLLLAVHAFHRYPYETPLMALVMLNPIDLGRILVLLQLDISALMGFTGALFRKFYGSDVGTAVSSAMLLLYAAIPIALGLLAFRRKDF